MTHVVCRQFTTGSSEGILALCPPHDRVSSVLAALTGHRNVAKLREGLCKSIVADPNAAHIAAIVCNDRARQDMQHNRCAAKQRSAAASRGGRLADNPMLTAPRQLLGSCCRSPLARADVLRSREVCASRNGRSSPSTAPVADVACFAMCGFRTGVAVPSCCKPFHWRAA